MSNIFKHYKGEYYKVLYIAHDENTLEDVVVYQALNSHSSPVVWIRRKEVWQGEVDVAGKKIPRFAPITLDKLVLMRHARNEDAYKIRHIQSEGWHDNNVSPETGITVDFLIKNRKISLPPNEAKVEKTKAFIKSNPLDIIVACINDAPIGYIQLHTLIDACSFGLYVSRGYRNIGVGGLLMQKFLAQIDSLPLQCHVVKSNFRAIHLYEKYGFRIVSEDNEYYDDAKTLYLPTFLMKKL
jgi:GNAT superfamily N-acetyltransferase